MTWFALKGMIFSVYTVLDGFDLGVGFWYLFSPLEERQLIQNKTGRFWYDCPAPIFCTASKVSHGTWNTVVVDLASLPGFVT